MTCSITRLPLDRSTVRKENLWPNYLERNGIKDNLQSDRQTNKKNIFTFRRLNKMTVENKTMKCLSCLLVTTLFAIKQHKVYSECNINTNSLFNKETKTTTCMSNTTTKEN